MTTSKIIEYRIIKKKTDFDYPTFMVVLINKKCAMRKAIKYALKMGAGAIIQRVSEKKNGKIYVKEWEYAPHN